MDSWGVKAKDFPTQGTKAEKLAFCLRYAVLAHSTYNTQPWHFKIKKDTVSIYIDRRYALPVVDPDDREAVMACSGAMFALRLAIRNFGYKEVTEILPDASDQSLIGRVRMGDKVEEGGDVDPLDRDLFEAVTRRHLNYAAFSDRPVEDAVIERLKNAASKEGAWLHICNEYERYAIIEMIAEGDHIQMSDKKFRRELAAWQDPRRKLSRDGVPCEDFDYKRMTAGYQPSPLRRFEAEDRSVVKDENLNDEIPVLAVLGCSGGGMKERIYAGQAFARVLLRAEAEGLSVSTLNQPCEVPELRLRLHDEIEQQGRAQTIVRIGHGGLPVKTPRRQLSDVLEVEGKEKASKAILEKAAQTKNDNAFDRFKRLFVAKSK